MKNFEDLYNFVFLDWKHGLGSLAIIVVTAAALEKIIPRKITINLFKRKTK